MGEIIKLLLMKLIGFQVTNAGVTAVAVIIVKILGDAHLSIG